MTSTATLVFLSILLSKIRSQNWPRSIRYSSNYFAFINFRPSCGRKNYSLDNSDTYSWITDELEQSPNVCDPLHFSDGYALYDYTGFGLYSFDKTIHIVSRRSLCQLTSTDKSRIHFGYHYITDSNEVSFLYSQRPICERQTTADGDTMT